MNLTIFHQPTVYRCVFSKQISGIDANQDHFTNVIFYMQNTALIVSPNDSFDWDNAVLRVERPSIHKKSVCCAQKKSLSKRK